MPSNIFDWKGPEFLALYIAVMFGCLAISLLLRWMLRYPADEPRELPNLDSYEAAYLAGGSSRVADVAIARLVSMKILDVKRDGKGAAQLVLLNRQFRPAHVVEQAVMHEAASEETISTARTTVGLNTKQIRDRMRELGFLPGAVSMVLCRIGAALFLLLALGGINKIIIGLDRDKPTGLLVLLVIATFALATWLIIGPSRSRRGDLVLKRLKDDSAALKLYVTNHCQQAPALDVGYALALFGPTCLSESVYPELRGVLTSPYRGGSGNGSGCGGGCGGGGCGGGCGGCGGCGS